MNYVDGFVIPIKKANVPAYKKIASDAGKVWKEYGALEYYECIGEQLDIKDPGTGKMLNPFKAAYKLKDDETLIFSWILYKNKKHRDEVNAKVMEDPRITEPMQKTMPFDMARMCFGGFEPIVKL